MFVALGLCAAIAVVNPTVASAQPGDSGEPQLVIRVADGKSAADVADRYGVTLVEPLMRSRNLWVAEPDNSWWYTRSEALDYLGAIIAASSDVEYAERYTDDAFGDTRMRAWPHGAFDPVSADGDSDWLGQPAARALGLPIKGASGAGVEVAVLDTGASSSGAPNASQVSSGYDYIDDDHNAKEVRDGVDTNRDGRTDGAYGHGTFVAGQVNLVAPASRVRAYRVLDSDGVGNPYVIAEAVDDAVDDGVEIINMSFGSENGDHSRVLDRAIKRAADRGVVVVAAAGNRASSAGLYPGNADYVLSVACGDPETSKLAGFSSYGSWVDVAAPCEDILGSLPDATTARWSGTSLSAPLVAGQAALIRARYPSLDRLALVRSIKGAAGASTSPGVATGVIDIAQSIDDARSYE